MSYTYPETRKFLGLFAQPNTFALPDGAMEVAENVVMNDDNTISTLRGFYEYYDPSAGTINNLFFYKDRLMVVFLDRMSYLTQIGTSPNYTATATDLTGAANVITSPRVSRSAQQSGNLYWTTDNGVLKIDDYNGKVFLAGAPPGLDLRGSFLAANGPVGGDTEIAYRVVFGRRDANDNLLLGAPSDITTLTNAPFEALAWTRAANVVTVSQTGLNVAAGMTIVITESAGGAPNIALGTYTIATVGAASFTFAETAAASSGTLSYTATRSPRLEFTVPPQITTTADNYFFQIYRTTQTADFEAEPSVDFKLVEERALTVGEIGAHVVVYQDQVDDVLLTNAPELYTNPNSAEGELQANARPPLAADIALFQDYVFYANCTTRHVLQLDLIDAGTLANNDYVEIKVDLTTRRYVAKAGIGNQSVKSDSVTNAAGNLQVNYLAHGFSNGWAIFISTVTGGTLAEGIYYVISAAANTFQISLTSGGAAVAFNGETSLFFEGVTDGTYGIFSLNNTSPSVGTQLRQTAQGLVKAINRDPSTLVYGNYVSAIDDTPGKMKISAANFTGAIYMRANTATAGSSFSPVLPDSFASGTQVFSRNASQPNRVYISKVGEPEAVPIVNNLTIGSKNKAIQRILSLRDSVIVMKEDGVYKITGDSLVNFSSTQLDNTIIIVAPHSAALLNNQAYMLTNQGICVATDSAVQIVSRRIEDEIEPVIGATNIATETFAVGYESDRTYRISTIAPNETMQTVTYLHNTINDTWTTSTILFRGGVVGPSNTLFLVSDDSRILRERKNQTRIDYSLQNYAATVVSVGADNLSAVVTVVNHNPEEGDVLVKDDVFTRIRTVAVSGSDWLLTFDVQTNLLAADTPTLYGRIVATVKMAPFHGGIVGLGKQFAQVQVHTRTANISRLKVSFTGQQFGGSPVVDWLASSVQGTQVGWGFAPWGYFPWGQTDGINTQIQTQPAPIIRTWVPQFQQRNTFIQLVLEHSEAGESMDIQAISWSMRAYKERVSK